MGATSQATWAPGAVQASTTWLRTPDRARPNKAPNAARAWPIGGKATGCGRRRMDRRKDGIAPRLSAESVITAHLHEMGAKVIKNSAWSQFGRKA